MTVRVRLPLGVADRLPERVRALAEHAGTIATTFDLAGYEPVDTPPFELLDVLEGGLGEHAKQALFRMVDPATGEVVVLRPDFTAQVARLVTLRMQERPRPLRLSYRGRVLRAADPLGRGMKSREVYQAGAELIGARGRDADVELLTLGARALGHLGSPLVLDLGHAAFIRELIPAGDAAAGLHRALAVKDREVLRRLAPAAAPLAELFGGVEVLSRARRELAGAGDVVLAAIDELEDLAAALSRALPGVQVGFDLGEPRGLGYYTGAFFHGYVRGAPDAVLAGGRYDGLLARYGAGEPAVGLAIDLDAIASSGGSAPARRGVVLAEEPGTRERLTREAEARRLRGERAVLIPSDAAVRYARSNGYRAIVQVSPDGGLVEAPITGE